MLRLCQSDDTIDAGIFNGGILFAKHQKSARASEIAVILMNEDMAVRRVYPEGQHILPARQRHPEQTFIDVSQSKGFEVFGVVVRLLRWLDEMDSITDNNELNFRGETCIALMHFAEILCGLPPRLQWR